jgi:glycosyltransferase involved in cell wall biosynthesis
VTPPTPLFPDIGVIGLVPDIWGAAYMPRHRVMTLLARYFNVVWMEPPRGWREWWLGEKSAWPVVNPRVPDAPGFRICSPGRWLPELYRPRALGLLLRRLRLRQAARQVRRAGARRLLLYLWRPEFEYALDLMPGTPSCYHIDDEYTFSDVDLPIPDDERRLLRDAGQVIIHSPGLLQKKGHVNPRTIFVPNGVDYRAYATPAPEPPDLRAVPHPRAGYVGLLKPQLDFGLLLQLAQRQRGWSFVLVGPKGVLGAKRPLVERLEREPNVHLLGGKTVEELPAYTQHFDVGMMCYEVNDYTNYIYPLKLHEYLACGLPVVASPIRTLLDFGSVITLARTPDEWSAALEAARAPGVSAAEAVEARRSVARQHDWSSLVAKVARSLCELLGPDDLARFDALPPVPTP